MFPGGHGDVSRTELAEVYSWGSLRALLTFFLEIHFSNIYNLWGPPIGLFLSDQYILNISTIHTTRSNFSSTVT